MGDIFIIVWNICLRGGRYTAKEFLPCLLLHLQVHVLVFQKAPEIVASLLDILHLPPLKSTGSVVYQ
jgi:hypothetical protein